MRRKNLLNLKSIQKFEYFQLDSFGIFSAWFWNVSNICVRYSKLGTKATIDYVNYVRVSIRKWKRFGTKKGVNIETDSVFIFDK